MRILSKYIPYEVANITWNWLRISLDLILKITPTQTPPKKCKNIMAIFSLLKLSNLVWYVHNMMGNFIHCVIKVGGGGGLPKRSFLITRGGEGVQRGSKTDHKIFEQPLKLKCYFKNPKFKLLLQNFTSRYESSICIQLVVCSYIINAHHRCWIILFNSYLRLLSGPKNQSLLFIL